ncbi:SDR family NAD(P)-dependent oxidoreductase [Anabaena sp. PCC 7108]|uniref:SDR family NAD(P)-dependent oxidoreductase n=1 Tax=Anabaena sp. PCC 7108 TaxID=163908 RepID=UPI000347AE79|nr:SDR family NAD(P)-dependent oxidoreductase [Anabaena sp. PCC 7108]
MEATHKPLPLIDIAEAKTLTGLHLITEDQLGVAAHLVEALQLYGITAAILTTSTLGKKENLAQVVSQLKESHGSVVGIIHLAGLTNIPMPTNFQEWCELADTQSKSLFHLLQLCANDLKQSQGQVLAASMLGGNFGRRSHCGPSLPLSGSSNGLLKTMMIEWPTVKAKSIDFAADTGAADIATSLVGELISQNKDVEIGYPQGQRTVFDAIISPLITNLEKDTLALPSQDWIVLCIGGSRGITSEIVSAMLVPGMTLILVGRSPKPIEEPSLIQGIEDIGILRRLLIQQAREEGQTPTPAQIEQQVKQLQRDRAIRDNLNLFKEAGANVEYYSVDVTDVGLFGALIDQVYERYGRIDAVVQGAGIIQDKLIIDKTTASFEQVFNTKVNSTFILSRYLCPESLKLMVIFASVAGRTGNRGQCDYAAANEVINRFAWWMHYEWPNTKVLSINWGPWDVTGMASEEVNRQFRERGVIPIPPAAGKQFFINELLYGNDNQVELITGFFEGEAPESTMAGGDDKLKQDSSRQTTQTQLLFPFIPTIPTIQPNGTVSLNQTISLSSHPYLQDHCLDGKPVLAAACAMELMAEFVQSAWPDWIVSEVRDLKVLRGIVLKSEKGHEIKLQARASTHTDGDTLQVAAEILDSDGAAHYRAFFVLRPQLEEVKEIEIPSLNINTGLNISTAYQNYCFHGPLFQLLTSIDRFNEQGMEAKVNTSAPAVWLNNSQLNKSWLFDPGLIDASLQMALIWTRIHGDMGGLPARFKRIIRYGEIPLKSNLRVELRVKLFNLTTMVFDAMFMDSSNRLYLRLEDMENTCSKALNRLTARE